MTIQQPLRPDNLKKVLLANPPNGGGKDNKRRFCFINAFPKGVLFFMSVFISLHAGYFREFLEELDQNRKVLICDTDPHWGILYALSLSGKECRPFTDEEVATICDKYKYFREYYTKMGLLPTKSLYDKSEIEILWLPFTP